MSYQITAPEDTNNHASAGSKHKRQKTRLSYYPVFTRVLKTCKIYLNSTFEDREKVDPSSRFYYVKAEVDKLELNEQQEFLAYLEKDIQFATFSNTKITRKTPDGAEQKEKTLRYRFYKRDIIKYLRSDKYGLLLMKLMFGFLKKDNPDLMLFVGYGKEEKRIGEIVNSKQKRHIISHFLENEDELNAWILRWREVEKSVSGDPAANVQGKQEVLPIPEKLYSDVLNRVIQTCKMYLNSSSEDKASITEESRCYYVKLRLEQLDPTQQQIFLKYLDRKKYFAKIKVEKYKRKVSNGIKISESHRRMFNKGAIDAFLQAENQGVLLLDLILDFLDESNPDFKSFVEDGSETRSKRRLKSTTLDQMKLRYKNLDRTWHLPL